MLFNSYPFLLLFLPMAFGGFLLLGKKSPLYAAGWLLAASLFFYGWWSPRYVLLLLVSITFNFWIAGRIAGAFVRQRARLWLIVGISVNLLVLGWYKYAHFSITNFNALFGSQVQLAPLVLPLGISFYTFTQIAFLVDTWQGQVKEYHPIRYGLFVTYFPHLIAGPVLHHKEMMPQFAQAENFRLNWHNVAVGLSIFAVGLFKKVILADNIGPFVAPVFDAAHPQPGLFAAWGAVLAYTLQLYFDFSGYSDMAIGLSRLFGVKLPLNFNSPYKAANIIEFWRRWHMTLSRFLRDYLYIPLGGSRHGRSRRYLNLLLTMILGGLWHGAGWTFVLWGALHGLYLCINHGWRAAMAGIDNLPTWLGACGRMAGIGLTFVAVVVAWVFFRAPNLSAAGAILGGMAGWHGLDWNPLLLAALTDPSAHVAALLQQPEALPALRQLDLLLGLLLIVWGLPNTQQWMRHHQPALDLPEALPSSWSWQPNWVWLAVLAAAGGWAVLSIPQADHVSEFLYYQF